MILRILCEGRSDKVMVLMAFMVFVNEMRGVFIAIGSHALGLRLRP